MTTNETMRELLEMIGGVELLDEDKWGWQLVWDEDYWRWCPGVEQMVSTMCRYPCEAQALIEKAAIEWLRPRISGLCIDFFEAEPAVCEITWVNKTTGLRHRDKGPTLLEALHAAVREVKEQR